MWTAKSDSQLSRKRPPRKCTTGGRLREVVARRELTVYKKHIPGVSNQKFELNRI